jgi:CRISPR system Cascade subunit CasD
MSHLASFLALRLEGPLQSWGERARWSVRDTGSEPTKSGVVGLLAACLGWGPDQDEAIAALAQALLLGVRVDRPGRALIDFHTVGGGRPPTGVMSAGDRRGVKQTAKTHEPETVVSRRTYLADASFLAVVQGQADLLERLAAALDDPAWPPFLGRKSCPPSVPLRPVRLDASDLEDALTRLPLQPRPGERPPGRLRAVIEVPRGVTAHQPGLHSLRQDVPLSLVYRHFGTRTVRETFLDARELPQPSPSPEAR